MYARFTLDQTLETFLRGHALAFEALGGVPRRILYDNLKSVVLKRIGERADPVHFGCGIINYRQAISWFEIGSYLMVGYSDD